VTLSKVCRKQPFLESPSSRATHAPPRLPLIHGVCHRQEADEIGRLLEAYRGAVNFYVRSLWQHPGALGKRTLAPLPAERTRLQMHIGSRTVRATLRLCRMTCR
jgi:hypothetical protein